MIKGKLGCLDHEVGAGPRQARISLGYSIEGLSIVTGLTVKEIVAAEMGEAISQSSIARLRFEIGKFKP